MNVPWSDQDTELLKKLWNDGYSCSQIAMQLGSRRSRNAVIGRIHRLGLAGRMMGTRHHRTRTSFGPAKRTYRRDSPYVKAAAKLVVPRREPSPVQKLLAEPFVPVAEPFIEPRNRKPILVRKADGCLHANDALTEQSCRWPCGDPGTPEFGFCGREKITGIPYCETHARIAYRMPNAPTPRPPAAEAAPAIVREKVAA